MPLPFPITSRVGCFDELPDYAKSAFEQALEQNPDAAGFTIDFVGGFGYKAPGFNEGGPEKYGNIIAHTEREMPLDGSRPSGTYWTGMEYHSSSRPSRD
jgi:hypothetical protein